jgi:hypothetical protein
LQSFQSKAAHPQTPLALGKLESEATQGDVAAAVLLFSERPAKNCSYGNAKWQSLAECWQNIMAGLQRTLQAESTSARRPCVVLKFWYVFACMSSVIQLSSMMAGWVGTDK